MVQPYCKQGLDNVSHERSQDFERVGEPRGGCRISGSGRGTMEGPKAPSKARRREAPERRGGEIYGAAP